MNLHQLRIFYTVAQLGSMTAAAKQLYISQPAVTKQVHLLEENYGVTLVERNGRGIKLTALGKAVYQQAGKLFDQAHAIERLLQSSHAPVRIGGTQITISRLIAADVAGPGIRYQAQNTQQTVALMKAQQLDFAILPFRAAVSGFDCLLLTQDQWVFVAAPKQVPADLTLAALLNQTLIVREPGSETRVVLGQTIGTTVFSDAIETNSPLDAIRLAENGQGIYFTARSSVQALLDNGKLALVTLRDYQPTARPLYLYVSAGVPRALGEKMKQRLIAVFATSN